MIRNVLHNLFHRPATRTFPATVREPVAGYRGAVQFGEGCNYCGACAARCPANAIQVDRAAQKLTFDLFRCIHCASCAEACKRGCVQLQPTYQKPLYERPPRDGDGLPADAAASLDPG